MNPQDKAQYWQERAELLERRLNGLRDQITITMAGRGRPIPERSTAEEAIGEVLLACDELARTGDTVRAYLWAVVEQVGGQVIIPDAALARALGSAVLRVQAPRDGRYTHFIAEAAPSAEAPATPEAPRIITP